MLTSRGLPSDSMCVLKAEPGKLDIKRRKPEACSTMRALGVLSGAFSLNASARQGACKCLRFKSLVYRLKIKHGYQNNNGIS